MKVICPHVGAVSPATVRALDDTGYAWKAIDVSASDHAYTDLVWQLWREGETFVLVEHDIEVFPEALAELEACSEPWCAFRYDLDEWGLYAGLGCVKFDDALLHQHRRVIDDVWRMRSNEHPPGYWEALDLRLAHVLAWNYGVNRHVHNGVVGHRPPKQGVCDG